MKFALLAALLMVSVAPAFAEDGNEAAKPSEAKTPPETVRVADEATEGLFERIRGAHLRAVQRGALAVNEASPTAPGHQ
jgi:hypothetical protein